MIKAKYFYKSSINEHLGTFSTGNTVVKPVSFGMLSSVVLSSLLGATGAIAAEVDAAVVAVKPVVVAQPELKKPSNVRSFPAVSSAEVLLAMPENSPTIAQAPAEKLQRVPTPENLGEPKPATVSPIKPLKPATAADRGQFSVYLESYYYNWHDQLGNRAKVPRIGESR